MGDKHIWQLLEANGEALIDTKFGRADGAKADILPIADEICKLAIKLMLDLETPNLREINLMRIIAFGHTWSPSIELQPDIPLRHGHAISIDMAYSTTLAWTRGYITEAERDEIHGLFSRVGLSMDHEVFDDQQFVVPKPIGTPYFINDASMDELKAALKTHKEIVKGYPRQGAGLEAYVDAGDLGQDPEELLAKKKANGAAHVGSESSKSAAANGTGAELNGKAKYAAEAGCCA